MCACVCVCVCVRVRVRVRARVSVIKPLQAELLYHRIHTFQPLLKVNNLLLSFIPAVRSQKLQVNEVQTAQLILLSYGHAAFCADWTPSLRRPPSTQKRGAQRLSSVEHLLPSVPDNTGRL